MILPDTPKLEPFLQNKLTAIVGMDLPMSVVDGTFSNQVRDSFCFRAYY